jgi:dCMP deaminase
MKQRQKIAHMQAAYIYASLSYCIRRQVGCVIVKDDRIISIGWNGTPSGEDNCCEDSNTGDTKDNVLHAEDNALRKIPLTEDLSSAFLFSTTCPCMSCAEKVVKRRVGNVIYDEAKNTNSGLAYMQDHGISVEQLSI